MWSFGCVMYEVWSLGHKPFEDHSNSDVSKRTLMMHNKGSMATVIYVLSNKQAVKIIDDGYRLPPPPGLSKELYKIMIQCWYYD